MKERLQEERGAIAVLAALTIVILLVAVAFVIDISRLYHERQVLQNAVDFGSLAGAQDLPVQGTVEANLASANALKVATENAPQVTAGNLTITFQCIVGDRNGDGIADPEDIPFVCGPTGAWTSGWTAHGSRMIHDCNPFAGDKCNTIRLSTSDTIPYYFAPVIGINTGSTGAVNAASCKGACGAAASPIDVVMVLDRTGSMLTPVNDIPNLQNAALAVLDFYDPSQQWVGMVSLPYGQPGNKCIAYGDNRTNPKTYQNYPDSNYLDWQAAPLSKDFKRADGSINPASLIVQQINCMTGAASYVQAKSDGGSPSGNHTNLGDPLDAARDMLALQGRPDVPDVIIFMTDGQANQPSTRYPCKYFNDKATIAKSSTPPQTIFTIGYGVDNVKCPDSSGPFYNKYATTNMTSAATQPTFDETPGTCNPNENKDGDHYFCTPALTDLEPVFRQVAAAAIETAHLID